MSCFFVGGECLLCCHSWPMDYLMILIGIGGGDYLFLRLFIPHYFYGGLFGVLNG